MTRRDEGLLRGDLEFVRTGDEGIVYDDAGGQVHVLNGSGARLWELLTEGLTRTGGSAPGRGLRHTRGARPR